MESTGNRYRVHAIISAQKMEGEAQPEKSCRYGMCRGSKKEHRQIEKDCHRRKRWALLVN